MRNRPATTHEYERLMKKHFLPILGRHKIGDLHARHVFAIIARLSDVPSEANHALTAMKAVLNYAVQHHLIPHNPCAEMPLPSRQQSRERVLRDDDLVQVFRAAAAMNSPFGQIVRLCILTGQRRGETAKLKWDYINEKDRMIILPAAIVKNNREHSFPYGDMVAETLPFRTGHCMI